MVGQVGGLSRISQSFALVNAIIVAFVIPNFARSSSAAQATQWMVLPTVSVVAIFGIGIFLLTATPGVELVWFILGDSFRGLTLDLTLALSAGALSIIGGMLFQLCASRGWRLTAPITVFPNLVILAVSAWWCDTSTLRGALIVNLVCTIPNVFIFSILSLVRMKGLFRSEHANKHLYSDNRPV